MVNKSEPKGKRGKTATTKPARAKKAPAVKRQLKFQKALYEIADAASAVTDMQEFYAELHRIVGKLMYAENFFIALHDEQSDLITWPYYVDTVDVIPPAPIPLSKQRGATGWILQRGKTLADVDGSVARAIKSGEIRPVGTESDGIGIPLQSDGKNIGVLIVQSYKPNIKYTLQDIEILNFVAQHISTALTRARAIEETRQRNTELQVINRVQEGLASNLDIQSIYTLVGDELREIFAADTTFIAFREEARNLLHVHYYADRVLRRSFSRPYRTGIAEVIIDSGQPLLLRNEQEQQEHGALHVVSPGAEKDLNQSVLGVPIFRDGKACGAVTVQSYKVNAFDENDLRLLQTLTNSMSVALENARLFDETQQRNAELAIINSVQAGLASKLDLQAIYELIGETVRKVFNVQVMDIVAYDSAANLISMPYSYEKGNRSVFSPREPYGFRLHVINRREPFLINKNFVELAEQHNNPLLTGAWPKSALFVPLLVEGVVNGIISIQDLDRENAYTPTDVRLLQTLANSMSVALENARLFGETQRLLKETEQRNAELAVINSIQAGLASKLDMQAIYELVGEKIRQTFNAQVVNIVTYDRATQLMHGRYFFEAGEVLPGITRPAFGFRMHVIETGQPIVINKDMPRWIKEYDNPVIQGLQSKSAIFIPLSVGREVIGVISLQNSDQENAFSEADVRLLTTLANSMSVALENAGLFDQTQQRNAELAVINSVQEGLASKLDMQSIYNLVGDKITEVFDAQGVTIATYDPVTNLLHYCYSIQEGERIEYGPMPLSEKGFRPYIVRTGQPLRLDDVEIQGVDYGAFMLQPTNAPTTSKPDAPKSWLGVPLLIGNEVRGVVNLYNVDRTHAYSESDMRLLETLANSMSVALENARLWEQEKLYRKALERELEIGREIQAGFLPERLPRVEGWEIAASLMSAREVAGDFYDVFELPQGTIGLVIADVCDKGVGAALFMTLFRSLIRITASQESYERTGSMNASLPTTERLQRAISLTNNYIAETHYESGMFATLFFGILDPRGGTLTYINGGHEPPLIIQAGQVRESLCKTGPAVGALMDCRFDVGIVQLQSGEMLFAFTDGAPEAKDPRGEFFGRQRLLDTSCQFSRSANEIVSSLEAQLRQHIGSATQFDDITLLAVRRVDRPNQAKSNILIA